MNAELHDRLAKVHIILAQKEKLDKQIEEEEKIMQAKAEEVNKLKWQAYGHIPKARECVHYRVGWTFLIIGIVMAVITVFSIKALAECMRNGVIENEPGVVLCVTLVIVSLGAFIAGGSLMGVYGRVRLTAEKQEKLKTEYETMVNAGARAELEDMANRIKALKKQRDELLTEKESLMPSLPEECQKAGAVECMSNYVKEGKAETIEKAAEIYKRRERADNFFGWLITNLFRVLFFWLEYRD